MKRLSSTLGTVLMLLLAVTMSGQQVPSCPTIRINHPTGGYLAKSTAYHVTADLGNYNGSELKYFWTFTPEIPFEMQGKPYVTFIADREIEAVKVSVNIEGLPTACRNTSEATFQIVFNPGSPLIFDEYEKLPLKKELERLSDLASRLSELKDSDALFDVGYRASDTRDAIKVRVRRIVRHLTEKRGVSISRLRFAFRESPRQSTLIYSSPRNAIERDWNSQIQTLKIPRK